MPTAPAEAAPATVPGPQPLRPLSASQTAFLERVRTATLAVNDAAGAPHLTGGWFHWDGEVFRLPTRFFTARATNLARDPRVSLFLHDPATGEALTAVGDATLVSAGAYTAFKPLLEKYRSGEDPVAVWGELNGDGDQIVVLVRPVRLLWHTI
jgi:hypothetical protein